MKVFAYFNAYAGEYEVKGELRSLGRIEGIESYQLLRKVQGETAQYCLEITVADDQAESVQARLKQLAASYPGDVTGTSVAVYKEV